MNDELSITEDEYKKIDIIVENGYLPADMTDSEIAYNPTYVFFKAKLEQVKVGRLSQEDLAKLINIINESRKEKNKHAK